MTPIQQMYLGVGASEKTYLDDVFSTNLYRGTGNQMVINNGIDLSTEGGLVWTKNRDTGYSHFLFDTERGITKKINTNSSSAEGTETPGVNAFNSNGFRVGSNGVNDGAFNHTSYNYSAFTFRKAPGFFTCLTYVGSGSNRTISHDLGSVPGMILVKNLTDSGENWVVYHRGTNAGVDAEQYFLQLNENLAQSDSDIWGDTAPTASVFSVGTNWKVNGNGKNYVAYVFAGGESTAATARSVDFDGSDDYLTIPTSDKFDVGTNWTAECWFKCDALTGAGYDVVFGIWSNSTEWVFEYVGNDFKFYYGSGNKTLGTTTTGACLGQWNHVAVSKEGSTTRLFLNGIQTVADFDMGTVDSTGTFSIGTINEGAGDFNGKISNVRVVQGTAVYTSSFRPPTEPLANITNTELLCCNNASVTGGLKIPGSISNNGTTASTDSPFDDPAGFVFGKGGDQNIIKTGSYIGNGSATGPEVNLGWEPQWVMLKRIDSTSNWVMVDYLRGIAGANGVENLDADGTGGEYSNADTMELTSSGFRLTTSYMNATNGKYIFLALRRPDPLVQTPIELGTSVFAMDTGGSSSTIPNFDSGFPVDWSLYREPASVGAWVSGARMTGIYTMQTNANNVQTDYSNWVWDSNVGWCKDGSNNALQSWMFKRHAGFDVVCYKGNSTNPRTINHSLGQAPQMIWTKGRNIAEDWTVGHYEMASSNPWNSYMDLNSNSGASATTLYVGTPGAISYQVASHDRVNGNYDYLALLFSSVSGISKVGSYTGSGSSTGPVISVGFQPKFILFKNISNGGNGWVVLDTSRGLGTSTQKRIWLNDTTAQDSGANYVTTTSTSFQPVMNNTEFNASDKYLYYAHS